MGTGSWPTRVRAIRWRNAREAPAVPQGGTIGDVCIVKNVCFLNRLNVEKQPIAAPLHAGLIWVYLISSEASSSCTAAGTVAPTFLEFLVARDTDGDTAGSHQAEHDSVGACIAGCRRVLPERQVTAGHGWRSVRCRSRRQIADKKGAVMGLPIWRRAPSHGIVHKVVSSPAAK